ncbi:MAG: response regulator [Proteobacteria bacterium]|nr:response regulator [Pseudomonadota bacterium]
MAKVKILIVDDNVANVELLEAYLLSADYRVVKAFDGQEGIDQAYKENPDLIFLDIMMPKLDGYEVCKRLKTDEKMRFIPIVMITALSEMDAKIKGLDVGADDFLSKPFNKLEMMARVRSLLRIKNLHNDLDSSENIIFTLALALEAKDPYTAGHSERVASLARSLAKEVGLPEDMQNKIHKAGILHDIGKIGISESILNKNTTLNGDEYGEVINHPSIGANICEPLKSLLDIIPMVRYHHERFDGSGHPDGLIGENTPLGARIISIADAFDAMTSARPYREAIEKGKAINIMTSEAEMGQWDPKLLSAFIKMMRRSD